MTTPSYEEIAASPEYQHLMAARRRFNVPLTILICIAYYSFVFLIAFDPQVLAQTVGDGIVTRGIWGGFGLIIFTFLVTWFYVRHANHSIEPLTQKLHQKMGK